MLKLKFIKKSNINSCPIFIRIYDSKLYDYTIKLPYLLNDKQWDFKKSKPKNYDSNSKNIDVKLKKLESKIFEEYNYNGLRNVEKDFFLNIIYNGKSSKNSDFIDDLFLLEFINDYFERRILSNNFKHSTNQKYKLLINKLELFEKFLNNRIRLSDFDEKLFLNFQSWLVTENKLNISTAQRTIKNLKTVLFDAEFNGYKINKQINKLKMKKIKKEKIYLSLDEIIQIKSIYNLDQNLDITRDWLLIGCSIGQRVSDLLRLTIKNIELRTNYNKETIQCIILTQIKTGAKLEIPIDRTIKDILKKYNDNFPPVFSSNFSSNSTLFNKYLKKLCEVANINEKVEGLVYNKQYQRNELVITEKFNLVSSHICRRTFATNNFSKIATPLLMTITGHKSEQVFYDYVGKKTSELSLQLYDYIEK